MLSAYTLFILKTKILLSEFSSLIAAQPVMQSSLTNCATLAWIPHAVRDFLCVDFLSEGPVCQNCRSNFKWCDDEQRRHTIHLQITLMKQPTGKRWQKIIDVRKVRTPHHPLAVCESEVDRISYFKFLGVYVSDLTWTCNITKWQNFSNRMEKSVTEGSQQPLQFSAVSLCGIWIALPRISNA